MEILLALDNKFFTDVSGGEYDVAKTFAKEVVSHANEIFLDLQTRVVLVGLEVWTDSQKITINTDPVTLLNSFVDYRKSKFITLVKHDSMVLITGVDLDGTTVGKAPMGSICGPASAAIVQYKTDAFSTAVIMVHEIGHTLGFSHDTNNCTCAEKLNICVMTPDTTSNPTKFSSCSRDKMQELFQRRLGQCLLDLPALVFEGPVCGNKIREKGEVCDCGTPEECSKDPCCDSSCRLRSGAQCSEGKCCSNCRISQYGVLCRAEQNECDIQEICDGQSAQCPRDLYRQDYIRCKNGNCFGGKCRSRDSQCQDSWGEESSDNHRACYTMLNPRGSQQGNCGKQNNAYSPCKQKDIQCGVLHCNTTALRPLTANGSVKMFKETRDIGLQSGPLTCRSFSATSSGIELGLVSNGSPCQRSTNINDTGVCVDQQCKKREDITLKSCPENGGKTCSGNGNQQLRILEEEIKVLHLLQIIKMVYTPL